MKKKERLHRLVDEQSLTAARLREVGRRVEFVCSSDPYTKLKPGDQGVIEDVDDLGTRHIKWDNGSKLGLIPKIDGWVYLTPPIIDVEDPWPQEEKERGPRP